MSFQFNWVFPNPQNLYDQAKVVLKEAVNKGPMSPVMADDISVESLDFGTIAPTLDIVDITDIGHDSFRGVLRMEYNGDFNLCLRTQIEANPLSILRQTGSPSQFALPKIVAASSSLLLPLRVEISEIRLAGVITVVFSPRKGLTILFDDNPLQSLKVSTAFDSIPSIASFIRREIETKMTESIIEDVPEMLHIFSRIGDPSKVHLRPISHVPYYNPLSDVGFAIPFRRPAIVSNLSAIKTEQCSLAAVCGLIPDSFSRCSFEFENPTSADMVEDSDHTLFYHYSTPLHKSRRRKRRVIKLTNKGSVWSARSDFTNSGSGDSVRSDDDKTLSLSTSSSPQVDSGDQFTSPCLLDDDSTLIDVTSNRAEALSARSSPKGTPPETKWTPDWTVKEMSVHESQELPPRKFASSWKTRSDSHLEDTRQATPIHYMGLLAPKYEG